MRYGRLARLVSVVVATLIVAATGCSTPPPKAFDQGPANTGVAPAPHLATKLQNRLSGSDSPYLKAGASQPVHWQPFDADAFKLAEDLDRPILLAIGATWCHWCRQMDDESYGNHAIAALINEGFVPVRVDADARPDLDRRYQQAAQVIAHEAGWPLTLFLTPNGNVFAGATYLPAEERLGRPGLITILERIPAAYGAQPEVISEGGDAFAEKLVALRDAGLVQGELGPDLPEGVAGALLSAFDRDNGGFGQSAKYPHPQAIDLALQRYRLTGDQEYLNVATKTLDAMAAGALRDQLGGAFYRFTLDPRWQVPHFEIVGSLNGALLQTYVQAYRTTGQSRFLIIAEGIASFLDRTLVDRERGGFYSGQDADVGPGDDGGYYTWTEGEIRQSMPAEEAAAVILYYGIPQSDGAIKGRAAETRGVLRGSMPVAEVGRELGIPADQARSRIEAGRAKLRQAREIRQAPPVDHSYFADRNGLLASAYLQAAASLGRADLRDTGLRAVERVLSLPRVDGLLAHYYVGGRPSGPAMLDDQTAVASALLDAFTTTGNRRYLEQAGTLVDRFTAVFGDAARGGFFDVAASPGPGTADYRTRLFDDGMTLGGNPLSAITLDRYSALAAKPAYRDQAEQALRAFAGAASEYGPFAAGYALAVQHHLNTSR